MTLLSNWQNYVQSTYSVNPIIFIALYIATIIPCWYLLLLIYKSIKNKGKNLISLVLAELFLLALPYLYVLLFGRNIPVWTYFVIIAFLFLSVYDFWLKINTEKGINNSSRIFWNIYAYFYRATIYQSIPHMNMFQSAVVELNLRDGDRVLDAGCGSGDLLYYLVKQKEKIEITGIDFSVTMLKKAKAKYGAFDNVSLLQADLSKKLPFESKTFDKITCVSVLFALPNARETISEYKRVLKDGGKVILIEPTPEFNYFQIVKEHLALSKKQSVFEKLSTYSLIVLKVPVLIVLYLMNLFMDRWEKEGKYHYFTKNEMEEILSEVGFKSVSSVNTLSGQDLMYVATQINN